MFKEHGVSNLSELLEKCDASKVICELEKYAEKIYREKKWRLLKIT